MRPMANQIQERFVWQKKAWPKFTFSRVALTDELALFAKAFAEAKRALRKPQPLEAVAGAMAEEAVRTSAIEGVDVDESVVMSSICRALGVAYSPPGFPKDARAEGVAQMMLAIRRDWNEPLSESLLKTWHGALLANDTRGVLAGEFRSHADPMRVVRTNAYGEMEIRYEAPPSARVPDEMRRFVETWRAPAARPADIALKAAFMHPHFESIHPFEDGNGRIGRALVAKTLAEGLGLPLVLPVSTVIARHRRDYYEEINAASQSLDWTSWAAFFIPVLAETLNDFLAALRFVAAKRDYLGKYEAMFSERAKKVVLRMFEDGESGVRAGLSAAKWVRMAKVSKPTATRDLAELEKTGAIVAQGAGPTTRYRLNCVLCEPIDPINDPINGPVVDAVRQAVAKTPGINRERLAQRVGRSVETVKRAIAALVAAGEIEHRGSRKTGGYYVANSGGNPKEEQE